MFDIGSGLDVVLLLLIVLTAVAAVSVSDLITSTILLGIFSLLIALQYMVLGAADVAITEAAVGAGISTILLLMALFLVGGKEKKSKKIPFLPIIVVCIITVFLVYVTFEMPPFGSQAAPSQVHVAPYYITNAASETGIPNTVTSILASYRGYDTFGETVVIFTAALAVILIIGRFKGDKEEG